MCFLCNVDSPDGRKLVLDTVPRLAVHLRCPLPHDLYGNLALVMFPQHFQRDKKVGDQAGAPGWDDDPGKVCLHDALDPVLVRFALDVLINPSPHLRKKAVYKNKRIKCDFDGWEICNECL